jgi:CheY-like chemotaxis protein
MTGEGILVVEDDGLIALHLTETLENAGYRVIGPAFSGESVLQDFASSPPPDLILMDVGLAGSLDGIETAAQIRKRSPVPIIFITAYSTERMLERMKDVSHHSIIQKPFTIADLLKLIRKTTESPAS